MQLSDLKGGYKIVTPGQAAAPAAASVAPVTGGPTFPAAPTDSLPTVALKTAGNVPSSTLNFGKSVLDFFNPISNAQKVGALADALKQNEADPANAPSVGDVAKEIPGQAYKMLVPQFLQHLFGGDIGKAAAALENDPVGQIAPLVLLAKQGADAAGKTAEFDSLVKQVASPLTKPIDAAAGAIKDAGVGATRFVAGQLTGISPDTIARVVSDPAQFSKEAEASVTRPAIADQIATAIKTRQAALDETGNEYSGIRTDSTPINIAPGYLDNIIKETTGLSVDSKGKLQTSGSASIRTPSDVSALQSKLYDVWKPEFDKGYLTPHEFLNFRADLARLANYDGGVGKSPALQNLSSVMRGKVNSDLRPQVPGLHALDAKFAPEQTALEQLTRGLVDKEGNLTDAAINRIANATGKGKDPLLARLEGLSPGITDRIKILKAVEDLQNSREVKTGTYLRAGALGAGVVTLNPYLIVSAVMSIPEVAVPLLRGAGYSAATISRVFQTLGLKEAATATRAAAKEALIKGGVAAPNAQKEAQTPRQ